MEAAQHALEGVSGDYASLARMAVALILLSLSAGPVGVFLMLRRMSLAGDTLSHAVLPGAAVAYLLVGLNPLAMTLGGLVAGLAVALAAAAVSRLTVQKEDASLAAFYLISLALGVLLVSLRGSEVDLEHMLFGEASAIDWRVLWLIAGVAAVTLVTLGALWRALIAECLDPLFLRSVSKLGPFAHGTFIVLVVLNLVVAFHALGTLLAVGLMMLPALAARFWANRVETMCLLAIALGIVSSLAGLLVSYRFALPLGPSIVLACGVLYATSLLLGTRGIAASRTRRHRHRTA